VNDGKKNVPFALPDEEEDVFSSVDPDSGDVLQSASAGRSSQGLPAVGHEASPSTKAPVPGTPPPAAGRSKGHASFPSARLTVEAVDMSVARKVEIDRPLYLIGGEGAHLHLQDPYVSRWHAQLRAEDGSLVLQDMGSVNGVYLRIADDLQLEDRDEIVLGNQRLIFRTTWDQRQQGQSTYHESIPPLGGNPPHDAARLVQMYSGGITGGVWRIRDRVTIGRTNADVSEPDDAWLSSPHATIERRGGKFFIKDAGSQYGTFIRVFDPVELIDGDCFIVGRSRIKISYT
jgi:pSer/pThr/pTyr-binding forkhead associated (FHA) protein